MREGVVASGVDWASLEVPDLAVHELNLVLYIHLRIFVYSSTRVLVEDSHDQFRADGLDTSLRYLEELDVFP